MWTPEYQRQQQWLQDKLQQRQEQRARLRTEVAAQEREKIYCHSELEKINKQEWLIVAAGKSGRINELEQRQQAADVAIDGLILQLQQHDHDDVHLWGWLERQLYPQTVYNTWAQRTAAAAAERAAFDSAFSKAQQKTVEAAAAFAVALSAAHTIGQLFTIGDTPLWQHEAARHMAQVLVLPPAMPALAAAAPAPPAPAASGPAPPASVAPGAAAAAVAAVAPLRDAVVVPVRAGGDLDTLKLGKADWPEVAAAATEGNRFLAQLVAQGAGAHAEGAKGACDLVHESYEAIGVGQEATRATGIVQCALRQLSAAADAAGGGVGAAAAAAAAAAGGGGGGAGGGAVALLPTDDEEVVQQVQDHGRPDLHAVDIHRLLPMLARHATADSMLKFMYLVAGAARAGVVDQLMPAVHMPA